MQTIKTIARIKDIDILILEEGEKRVPIRPICDLLGIDYSSQLKKIKNDEILKSTVVLSTTVGADLQRGILRIQVGQRVQRAQQHHQQDEGVLPAGKFQHRGCSGSALRPT